jgi:hypothetical protein
MKFVTEAGPRPADDFVIPAKAGIQPAAALDTGLRRCDDFYHVIGVTRLRPEAAA